MSELMPCEFFLFRYVPNVVRAEFVNIGALVRKSATPRSMARFTRDWSRVQAAHPDADVKLLEALGSEIAERVQSEPIDSVLQEFLGSLSNAIQIDGPHASVALTLEDEIDRLMRLYVESPVAEKDDEAR